MPNDRDERPGLRGQTRRSFLRGIALATVGGSTAVLSSEPVSATPPHAATSTCSEPKSPVKEVNGRVAFITGGSSGIGLGIARAFTDAGMRVIIGYRTKGHLEEAMKYLGNAVDRVHAIDVDVTDRVAMQNAADESVRVFGRVHVLVNNAGVYASGPLVQATYKDWDWQMGVNLNGVFNGLHAFLPGMLSHGEGGHVITTSSVAGLFSNPNSGIYSASKFAVVGLMEALRGELRDTNIGVSVFCPGMVRSNIMEASRNRLDRGEAAKSSAGTDTGAPKWGMDPLEAGGIVLRGMRNNDLYILSHPEYELILRDRSDALASSIPTDIDVPEERRLLVHSWIRDSTYAREIERKQCARKLIQEK